MFAVEGWFDSVRKNTCSITTVDWSKNVNITLVITSFQIHFQVKQRIMQILNMRGGSIKSIRSIMRGTCGFSLPMEF